MRPGTARLGRALGIVLALALTASACSSGAEPDAGASTAAIVTAVPTTAVPTTAVPTTAVPTDEATETTPNVSAVSVPQRAISLVDTLRVVSQPGSPDVIALLSDQTDFGSARVLLVEEIEGAWVRVQLPIRPNGTSGWVRSSDVSVEEIDARVEVDLAARTITTWINGEVLIQTSVAVGSTDNPTPTGTFFITDKIDTADDDGPYGPYALGLSAHSDTLTEFAGGEGQIGIHGTNAPESIGEAVSHGCIRLPNELVEILASQLPLGTPVIVR